MIKHYLNEALAACEKLLPQPPSDEQPTGAPPSTPEPPQFGQEWMQACQTVANILTSMGFVQEAYPWRSMALDQTPNSAKFYAASGWACSQCEDWEQAIYFCQRTLECEPDSATAHRQLAKVYHRMGDADAELETLNALLAKRPDKAEAEGHHKLGQVLRGRDQTSEAIACYQRAIEQDNQYEKAYYALGDLLSQQGNQAQTVELFAQMVQQLPEAAMAHYRLGKAYRQTQQLERAVESFRAAIALNPQLQWPYMGLANTQIQRSLFDEAIATCRSFIEAVKPLEQKKDTAWAYSLMGNAHAKKGERALAAMAHQEAFALSGWSLAAERDYQFKQSWFGQHISEWTEYFAPLNELLGMRHSLQALALGAQDDGSLLWLVDNLLKEPDDRLICLSDRISEQFQQNRAKLPNPDKVVLQTENISAQLEALPDESFDLAYIQSDCKQADYLQSVSTYLWKSLKPSGLMCFKSYRWQHPSDPSQSSKIGIDAFIASIEGDVEILCRSHQVILKKGR